MNYYILTIHPGVSEELAEQKLVAFGAQFLYSSFDEEQQNFSIAVLYGDDIHHMVAQFPFIKSMQAQRYEGIDWEEQWQLHCKDYQQGHLKLNLTKFYQEAMDPLILESGPGFGNLSHPTTGLVLQLMAPHCRNQEVIDIGCGCGILSLAALAFGAKTVTGIDIDPDALSHAKKNHSLNKFKNPAYFGTIEEFHHKILQSTRVTALMNMIHSEQKVAWESIRSYVTCPCEIITSGIIIEERGDYLKLTRYWGWDLVEELTEEQWIGFRFRYFPDC